MREALYSWFRSMQLAWPILLKLAVLNIMVIIGSLLVVSIGPAVLAGYWYCARVLRDEDFEAHPFLFFRALWSLAGRGIAWLLLTVAVLFVAYSNLVLWASILPPAGATAVRLLMLYLVYLYFAIQPSLLEGLAVEGLGFRQSLAKAAWETLANPGFVHTQPVIQIFAVFAGYQFTSFALLILVASYLFFQAVAAEVMPRKYPGSFDVAEGAS